MADLDSPVANDFNNDEAGLGSTDQGNVTYCVPAFHGTFTIPCPPGAFNRECLPGFLDLTSADEKIDTPGFTACAGTDEAHRLTIVTGKGMAVAGWRILAEDVVASRVRRDFEEDQKGLDNSAREGW